MEETIIVPLHEVAHSRTGDKGNRINASLIAYDPQIYPHLEKQITCKVVERLFSVRGSVVVQRFELPKLYALNFVIDNVLEGGVNGSLNLDGHGKTLSFLLLTLPLVIPCEAVPKSRRQIG